MYLCRMYVLCIPNSVNSVVEFPGAGLGRMITINSELNGMGMYFAPSIYEDFRMVCYIIVSFWLLAHESQAETKILFV